MDQDTWKPASAQEIWMPPSAKPVDQQKQPQQQDNESLLSKIFFHPLLPDIDSQDIRSSIGANTPIIKNIWPGGIELPNFHTLYRDIIQPASTGLGLLGTALGIGSELPLSRGATPSEAPLQPEVLPKETPIPETAKPVQQQLPAHRVAGYLPESAQSVPPRFYAGPAGIADARLAYPYDIQDPAQPNPQSISSGEPGVQQPNDIGPIAAANRTSFDVKDPAQLNPAFRALVPDRYGPQSVPLGLQGLPKDIPEVTQQYRSGGQIINPPEQELPFNSNQVDVINRRLASEPEHGPLARGEVNPHSPEAIAALADSNPQTKGSRPVPDMINGTPVNPTNVDDVTQIRAGQAKPTDIPGNIFTYIDSADKILDRASPITSKIANNIRNAQDQKLPWINDQLSQAEKYLGTDNTENQTIFNILDGKIDPSTINPVTASKAEGLRQVLDNIHGDVSTEENPVGYLTDYITHMKDDPSFGNDTIWNYFFKKPNQDVVQPILNKEAIGNSGSPYTETRTGELENYSNNLPGVLRAYVSSIAKAKFDQPAVDLSKQLLDQIPDTQPRLKALADAYVRNYTKYDAEGQLTKEMRDWSNAVANTITQSQLAFNMPFHMLHIGEIPASVFPELGARYTAIGMKNYLANPKAVTAELGRNGLLGNQIIPSGFKTAGEKWQTAMNFWNTAESVTKGIAYQGAKARALEQGMPLYQAELKAIADTKDMTYSADPARTARAFMPEGPVSTAITRLGGLYKSVPLKIIEQYRNIAADALQGQKSGSTAKAARLLFGASLAGAGTEAGLHTFHLNPADMISPALLGPFGDAMKQVANDLGKGDWESALAHTAAWVTPGGQQLAKLLK